METLFNIGHVGLNLGEDLLLQLLVVCTLSRIASGQINCHYMSLFYLLVNPFLPFQTLLFNGQLFVLNHLLLFT